MKSVKKRYVVLLILLLTVFIVPTFFTFSTYGPVEKENTAEWFEDAKLGIFIHWGLYSVPAYAPLDHNPARPLWKRIMGFFQGKITGKKLETTYSEWYYDNLQIDGKTRQYHLDNYGGDFDYYDFASQFNSAAAAWSPQEWARTFKDIGARYVVLVTKHHDGFTLWPSKYQNPNIPEGSRAAERDIVGELTYAVRSEDMKMGLYYSGGIDWQYKADYDRLAPAPHLYPDEYSKYADNQYRELIDKYKPALLWNDIAYPVNSDITSIVRDYRLNAPDGVVNNRWQDVPASELAPDYSTPEYIQFDEIQPFKWETCRGLGYSFAYNQLDDESTTLTRRELIHLLIDIVSKNGNLLLNIGPRADGSIPEIQLDRLNALGQWLKLNGEAIYATRPWQRAEGKTATGIDVRFTKKGDDLFAILLDKPEGKSVQIQSLTIKADSAVQVLGTEQALGWRQKGEHIEIDLPQTLFTSHAYTIKISQ